MVTLGKPLHFLRQGQIYFWAFIWEEFMKLVKDVGAKVNKNSEINEFKNNSFFAI